MRSEVELVWSMPFGGVGWGLIALGLAAVLVVAFLSTAGRPPALRALLFGLRLLAAAGLLLLLLRPSWRRADVTRSQDHLVILVDRSASMGLPAGSGRSRAQAAGDWLAAAARSLETLGRRHIVSVVGFDEGLSSTGKPVVPGAAPVAATAAAPMATPAAAPVAAPTSGSASGAVSDRGPGDFAPRGRATDLLTALETLRSRYSGRRLAGVVVLSDGRDTAALRDGVDARLLGRLRGLDVPVNVAPLGGAAVHDAAVAEVVTDDLAFVRNVTRIRAVLRVVGSAEPVQAELWIDGVRKETRFARGGEEREVTFAFVPDKVGQVAGRVRVLPVAGEATQENNERRFVLRVVRDRVRILQIAGRPSWDVRFLRQHFKRDPNVDLVSFFILRTHLNITAAPPHELSLIQFPAEELFTTHLPGFDLVVMQDFERYPPYVGRYLDNIAAWVKKGGALALTGGEHTLSLGGFAGSRLSEVLPVELLPPGAPSTLLDDQPFPLRPTPLADHHPVTRAGGGDGLSPEALGKLPPLEGVNKVARAHADAAVLAEHPRLAGADGKPLPVLVVRDIGDGRSFALLSDTSWTWRFGAGGEGPRIYDALWRRVVRYLIGDPEFGRLRLAAPAAPGVAGGPPITVTARATDARREPERGVNISWRLLALETGGAQAPKELRSGSGSSDDEGRLAMELGSLPAGAYRVEAKAVMGGRQEQAFAVLVAEGNAPELARVEPAPDLLAAVAKATGGHVLARPADLARAAVHPPRVLTLDRLRTEPLVGSLWLLLGLIVLVLGAEWALRRRYALA